MKKQIQVKEKNKGGRPKKDIDPKIVYDLAKIHCTVEEMASILDCTRETLYKRFSDIMQKGFDDGKKCLRRKMFEIADKGNVPMMIWLSKQHLSMKDKQPDEVANTVINVKVVEAT